MKTRMDNLTIFQNYTYLAYWLSNTISRIRLLVFFLEYFSVTYA